MIKQLLKGIIYHTKNTINSLGWIISMARNENFKNYISPAQKKNRLLILANGPSLKSVISEEIPFRSESDVCVVNDFARFPIFSKIKPEHYVLADPFYFSDFDNQRNSEIHNTFQNVDWTMNLYVPFYAYKVMRGHVNNPNISIVPYHSQPYYGWKRVERYLYKINLSMPRPQNVVIPSLLIAINRGYKMIDLYGVDHSWTEEIRVDSSNNVCYLYQHFFDKKTPDLKPWYKGTNQPVYKMHEILRDLAWMFDGYHRLREYADSVGCRIVNKTPGSFIDAFERDPIA